LRRCAAPAVAAAVSALVAAGCGAARETPSLEGDLTVAQARAFDDFPLYYAGESVDGLPLAAIVRRNDTASYVSFVYGDCEPAAYDQGCAPPAEIQVWPACRRTLELYGADSPGSPALEPTTIQGVPGALLDGGLQLELQAGRATVVVFGNSRARVSRIGRALRVVGSASIDGSLPAPVAEPCG